MGRGWETLLGSGYTDMTSIFLSYRRDDSRHQAGRLHDHLVIHFGPAQVFKDVDSIPLGSDFRKVLTERVAACDVFLAIIGDGWISATGKSGNRRLDDPADYVRIEVEAALSRKIPVIPVLVGNSSVPRANELPESLRELAFRNGIRVRPDPDFHNDMKRLIRGIESSVTPRPVPPRPKRHWILVTAVTVLGLLMLGAILYIVTKLDKDRFPGPVAVVKNQPAGPEVEGGPTKPPPHETKPPGFIQTDVPTPPINSPESEKSGPPVVENTKANSDSPTGPPTADLASPTDNKKPPVKDAAPVKSPVANIPTRAAPVTPPVVVAPFVPREIHQLPGIEGPVRAVSISADGRFAIACDNSRVRYFNVETGDDMIVNRLGLGSPNFIRCVALSSDGKRALLGGNNREAILWDFDTRKQILSFPHGNSAIDVSLTADGKYAITASQDLLLRVWSAETGKELMQHKIEATDTSYSMTSGLRFGANGSESGYAEMWEGNPIKPLRRFKGHVGPVYGVSLSDDGRRLLTGGKDGTVRLWDAEDGDELHRFTAHRGPVFAVSISADGQIGISGGADATVRVWKLAP